jgi:ribonuclease E
VGETEAETGAELTTVQTVTVDPEKEPKIESHAAESETSGNARRRGGRRSRGGKERAVSEPVEPVSAAPEALPVSPLVERQPQPAVSDAAPAERAENKPRRGGRRPRKAEATTNESAAPLVDLPVAETVSVSAKAEGEAKPAKAKRPSRPRKAKVVTETSES